MAYQNPELQQLIETLISDVASKHKVLLRPDDPILMTVSLHHAVLTEYSKIVQKSIEELYQKLEVLHDRTVRVSDVSARRFSEEASQRISDAGKELRIATQPLANELAERIITVTREHEAVLERTRKLLWCSIWVVCFALATFLVAWILLGTL